jgi:hypothetical protein
MVVAPALTKNMFPARGRLPFVPALSDTRLNVVPAPIKMEAPERNRNLESALPLRVATVPAATVMDELVF